jgi:hypothetical protein
MLPALWSFPNPGIADQLFATSVEAVFGVRPFKDLEI